MANIRDLILSIESADSSFDEKLEAINKMEETIVAMRQQEEQAVQDNVDLIVEAIKVMQKKVADQLEVAKSIIPEKGDKGDKGADGKQGKDGRDGKDGKDGKNGKDGKDGKDGVSVTDAKIDFDGSLVITLSTGKELNVGEVVAPDLAEKIKVINTMSTNGAVAVLDEGTSISTGVKSINFVGATVTATNSGDDVVVNVSAGTGTVTSVGLSGGTTGLTTSGSPITTTGTITLGGTLAVANGGTGQTSYTDGQLLIGNSTGNTLTKATLTAGSGIAITNGGGSISIAATNSGTVTSVTGTSPVVSSGGTTPAISLASGYGDTQNPYASKTANYFLAAPNGSAGAPTFRAVVVADIPTLNQNTTGTASNVTGTVAIANGGTGQTTASAAFNALSPVTSTGDLIIGNGTNSSTRLAIGANNYVLTSNGTTATWSAPSGGGSGTVTSVAATVPSFLSVTGSPITTSGTLAISLASTPTNGQLLIGNGTDFSYATLTAGSNVTITNSAGGITIASTGGGGGGSASPKALLDSWMIGAM